MAARITAAQPSTNLKVPGTADVVPALLVVAAVAVLALGAGADPARTAGRQPLPDFYMQLPVRPYNQHKAPVYVDAFEQPGKLLYRFDAVIRNNGGTLDLYRDPKTGHVIQAVWPGGEPTTRPDPNVLPVGKGLRRLDRHSSGARVRFVSERTHRHNHLFTAASYSLAVPGDARRSPKIGFCMQDTFADERYFKADLRGRGPTTWCAPDRPDDPFVRMGVSRGAGDLYAAQTELQWLDVTDVVPGKYLLRAEANPSGHVREATRRNNTLRVRRTIPGVRVFGGVASTGLQAPVQFGLPGEVVGPQIPARASADCVPPDTGFECYLTASARGPLAFRVERAPAHGALTIAASGLTGTATYTPDAGFTGVDSFSYTAVDERGLRSAPADVTIRTAESGGPIRSTFIDTSGGRVVVRLGLREAATVSGRVTGRGAPRRISSGRVPAGTGSIALGRLPRGSYRVELTARTASSRAVSSQTFRVR